MSLFPSDVFLAVAVFIAKAPNSLMSKRTQYVYVCTRNCPDGVLGFYFSTGHNTVTIASFIVTWLGNVSSFFVPFALCHLCLLVHEVRAKFYLLCQGGDRRN